MTQLSGEVRVKRLEVLRDMVGGLSRVVLLWTGSNPSNADGFTVNVYTAETLRLGLPAAVAMQVTDWVQCSA